MMLKDEIITRLQALPEIENWPEVATFFDRSEDNANKDWYIPVRACRAVGGDPAHGLFGAVAIACLQVSIMVVDDILDQDPRGLHQKWGEGETANLALALQAAPLRLIGQLRNSRADIPAVVDCLGHISLATATGQHLDVQNLTGEEAYWRVVEAKSTPFYGGAYKLGALLGGAGSDVADALYEFGVLTGEIIQIQDDLDDAFERPANADWHEGRNNLLILYGGTSDHARRDEFEQLLTQIQQPDSLARAQQILVECGAVSYAAYLLVERFKKARATLAAIPLVEAHPLEEMLSAYGNVLQEMLRKSGMDIAPELSSILDS